jgi:hypothetical protein
MRQSNKRTKKNNYLAIGLLIGSALSACLAPSQQTLTVQQLLANPTTYNGRVVNLTGWFYAGPESYLLLAVPDKTGINIDTSLWVDDVGYVEASERQFGKRERSTNMELLSTEEREVYKRLMSTDWPRPVAVVLRGEFQTSSTPRYGHLSAFKHRLILYKVLTIAEPQG